MDAPHVHIMMEADPQQPQHPAADSAAAAAATGLAVSSAVAGLATGSVASLAAEGLAAGPHVAAAGSGRLAHAGYAGTSTSSTDASTSTPGSDPSGSSTKAQARGQAAGAGLVKSRQTKGDPANHIADLNLNGEAEAGGAVVLIQEPAAAGKAPPTPSTPVPLTRREELHAKFSALKPFVIISLSYLLFTTTDGAIRMIVLLHAYNLGFTAMETAIMFSAYELAGVFTNLAAGMLGARWGIKTTLLTGLSLQLVGISVLFAWQESWGQPGQKWKGILFVTFAQMLCGIAKDLTKLGGKTVTKLVTPDEKQTSLFKLVSLITGWKNSLKGAGYFLGAACLALHYYFALAVLLVLIGLAMPWAIVGLSNQLGRARKENLGLSKIFKQNYNINMLSVSRFFLFGSRDMWFEVPLPFFLRNTMQGVGWSRPLTGLCLALFIIVYGQVQSWTPQMALGPLRQSPANKWAALLWCSLLVAAPTFLGGMVQSSSTFRDHNVNGMVAVLICGLFLYCVLFAVNSSIHSYLIVRYAEGDKVAMNIGFYYMANAVGRLTGTLVSGALYSYVNPDNILDGFAACFWASVAFASISAFVNWFLRDDVGGLKCGGCLTLVAPPKGEEGTGAALEVEVD